MRRWIVIARTACTASVFALAAGLLVSVAQRTRTAWLAKHDAVAVTPVPAARTPVATISAPAQPAVAATRAPATSRPSSRGAARVPSTPEQPEVTRSAGPHDAGMLVGIDPETGAIGMPTPEQRARLTGDRTITGNPAEGLLEERAADGTVTLHLDERFAQYSVVRAGKGGTAVHQCVDGREAATHAAGSTTPAPRAPEEE